MSHKSQEIAREIMGKSFFGIEEGIKYFEVDPSNAELEKLSEVPFTEERLRFAKNAYILVAYFPLPVFNLCDDEVRWCLVYKGAIPDRTGQDFGKYSALLNENNMEMVSAQLLIYTVIGHYYNTGERLFEKSFVRTNSIIPGNDYGAIGHFDFDKPSFRTFDNGQNSLIFDLIGSAISLRPSFHIPQSQ